MGKAAIQRRRNRMKYLARLANKEPKRFEMEWEKRVSSWLELIVHDAGRLKSEQNELIPPIFDLVDEAMEILRNCGKEVYRKYAERTHDLLTTECCRQFAFKVDRRLFKPNSQIKSGLP